jgi:hypothetical protein
MQNYYVEMTRSLTTAKKKLEEGDVLLVDLDPKQSKLLQELQNRANNIENLFFLNLLTLSCLIAKTTKVKEPLVHIVPCDHI